MRLVAGFVLLAALGYAQASAEEKQLEIQSFEKVWTTIRDKHWEKNPGGLDWQAIHDEYRPKIDQARTTEQARQVIGEMLERLHETHFAIFPGNVYDEVGGQAAGGGSPGMEMRALDGQVIVAAIDPGSGAEKAGVKTGWAVLRAGGKDFPAIVKKLQAIPELRELTLERALETAVSGPEGSELSVQFLDGANQQRTVKIKLGPPRGEPSHFGNLPTEYVWFETKNSATWATCASTCFWTWCG